VDHVVDTYSQYIDIPISYRVPSQVLRRMNIEMKNQVPYFGTIAEYMLWDNLIERYHCDMYFDVLWGDDMISQCYKGVRTIVEDNARLLRYNKSTHVDFPLSILKTYNNQDGEFEPFNQYPGQLGKDGALFKWFKLHFLPGGRSIMYVDGDESFTKTGVQHAINHEGAMIRNRDDDFYRRFNAIHLLSQKMKDYRHGTCFLHELHRKDGVVSWMILHPSSQEALLIIAYELAPTECIISENRRMDYVHREPIFNVNIALPEHYTLLCEYTLCDFEFTFTELDVETKNELFFRQMDPAEFHLYKLRNHLV